MNHTQTLPRIVLTVLRMAVGWHFLYEGVAKLFITGWSSKPFLANTTGFLADFYHWLAASSWLPAIDILNIGGLLFIGLALFVGCWVRIASATGTLLLVLYYFAYPPFGPNILNPSDGHLFVVDKLFIEAAVLLLLTVLPHHGYGVDELTAQWENYRKKQKTTSPTNEEKLKMRRAVLKNLVAFPVLGVAGWGASEAHKNSGVDITSGATIQVGALDLSELKGELPKGKLGKLELSRLIMGGNLIGGWAHSRDLLYTSSLFKAYNTPKKVYETLMLGEAAGINAINIGFTQNAIMSQYKKDTGSKIHVISQIGPNMKRDQLDKYTMGDEMYRDIDQALEHGCQTIQIQGNWGDWMAQAGRFDMIEKLLEYIRKQGAFAGMGAHTIDTLTLCEQHGIIPDYYMKTMHHDQYWSAHPKENRHPFEVDGKQYLEHDRWHDNMFCLFPERTAEFVNRAQVPVMGFKVLAGGAITPEDGFRWAFNHGADFICVGMFDFQIVKDVNICCDILSQPLDRSRKWFG